jgi:ribosomal protein S14
MQTTDHRARGGPTDAGPDRSYFRCAICGASEISADIEYDQFGYPECPVCGTEHGP